MENIWQLLMLIIILEIIKTIKNNRPLAKVCGYFFENS